ncbi:MAG: hypothetical protein K8S13_00670 [Desulfobacula sp.]|uniref:hypothetical protein n=1 Tax=Desulfobacula sp. TaxID=2593537 RepID=UPI0025C59B2E|nr:hypothetical protein [Desulfobacula sp.]MCD4718360.1 hypothetical protein [Desulfobacula sp.]
MLSQLQDVITKKVFAVLLIFGISMTMCYPLLSANIIELDDTRMITDLNNPLRDYSVKKIFWPGKTKRYYRPLLICSFVLDSRIWALEYSGYHLTNNILHTLNAIIIYFIGLRFFRYHPRVEVTAFLASLIFLIHPLTIESVAWISGRTDILGTFFSLLAYLFYLTKTRFRYFFVAFMVFLGLLSKENTLSILPIIVLSEFFFYYKNGKGIKSVVAATKWACILSVPLISYLYLRFAGFDLVQSQIEIVSSSKGNHLEGISFFSNLEFLPAMIAFYIKKLFVPFPLNFAISEINLVFYTILFFILAGFILLFIFRKKFFSPAWVLIMVLSFFPALPIALSDVAWTKYAERYLYLAVPVCSFFFCALIPDVLDRINGKRKIMIPLVCTLGMIFFIATIDRVFTWKDRFTLWADTYKKNPENGMVLYKYGTILGDDEGLQYFKKAVQVAKDDEWKDLSLFALAGHAVKEKDYKTAEEYVKQALKINSSRRNLYSAAGIIQKIMSEDETKDDSIRQFLIQIYQKAYEKKPRPVDLYNLINIYKSAEDRLNEERYYHLLQNRFPNSRAARNLFKKYNPQ